MPGTQVPNEQCHAVCTQNVLTPQHTYMAWNKRLKNPLYKHCEALQIIALPYSRYNYFDDVIQNAEGICNVGYRQIITERVNLFQLQHNYEVY